MVGGGEPRDLLVLASIGVSIPRGLGALLEARLSGSRAWVAIGSTLDSRRITLAHLGTTRALIRSLLAWVLLHDERLCRSGSVSC